MHEQTSVQFVQALRGEGTGAVDLPQNWASPRVQSGSGSTNEHDKAPAASASELEKENDALRRSLELLEENASLRQRIDEFSKLT